MPPRERERRLFVEGEKLRIPVTPPPTGGGPHYEPQTAEEARELLLPLVRSVATQAAQLAAELRGDRIYIEAQLLPNYLASSHFPAMLLSELGAVAVGSRTAIDTYQTAHRKQETVTQRLILAITDAGLGHFQRLIEEPGRGRSDQLAFAEIRKLDDVSMRSPDEVVVRRPADEASEITWEAVLHPSGISGGDTVALEEATVEKWFTLVERFGGRGHRDYVRRVGGLTFAPVTLRGSSAYDVARFNPLRVLRPMPGSRPAPRISLRKVTAVLPPVSTSAPRSEPAVAVFDGGVDNRSAASTIFPNADQDLTPDAPDQDDLAHGTAVVGATLYGLVRPGIQLPSPPLPVTSFRVFPIRAESGLDEYWLLDQITRALSKDNYRIVNLSLGPDVVVEDDAEPHRWTAELDHLAAEFDVLFVVAAGNNGNGDRTTGSHRVLVPGDMVNGLSVGACDVPPQEAPWTRTEYSAMGPGRHGNRIQPSGVQFGGNAEHPFPLLTGSGDVVESRDGGTSFATPLVTHALADLAARLPRPTANVLRAFAVHFAEKKSRKHVVHEIGHGRFPLSFERFLNCDADEAHVLFEDEIDRGDLLGYRIPLPPGLAGPVELNVTLAYSSPIEASQAAEYTRVSLDLALRPHQYMHAFTKGRERSVCDLRTDAAAGLMQGGWAMSQEPVTKGLGRGARSPEVDLRDAGKWETVKRHRVRLAADELDSPRIEIGHVARRNGRLVHESQPVRFALLVTIRDRSLSGKLYDRVQTEFPVLRPLAQVPSRARLRGRPPG